MLLPLASSHYVLAIIMLWVLSHTHVRIIRSSPTRITPKLTAFSFRAQWQLSFAQKLSFINLLAPGVSKLLVKLPRGNLVNKRILSSVQRPGGDWLHQQTGTQSLTSFPNWGHWAVSSFWATAIYLVKFTDSLADSPGYLTALCNLFLNQKMAGSIAWPEAGDM